VLANALVRDRATSPQVGLDAAARRRNLACAFRVGSAALVDGRHLILVDDVLTTGATADACARTLLAAGARRIDVAVVARTPLANSHDGGRGGLSTG